VKRLVWGVAIAFALLGATSGIMRAVFIDDLVTRVEPIRLQAFAALNQTDPYELERQELVRTVDARFSDNPAMTYAHVLLGAAYLAFGLLQFSGGIRRRYPAYHRWAGRALLIIGVVMALAGMYFGVVMPIGGRGEAFVIGVVGVLFLFALVRGFVAIRRRDRATHRVWMTRAFGIGLGITTVRIVAGPLDVIMTPMGYTTATIFVTALWLGWGLTTLGTEWWLFRTRHVPTVVLNPRPALD
jgi:uncharacterized membrane protein